MKKGIVFMVSFLIIFFPLLTRAAVRVSEVDEHENNDAQQQENRTEQESSQFVPTPTVTQSQTTESAPTTKIGVTAVNNVNSSAATALTDQTNNAATSAQTPAPSLSTNFPWAWVVSRGAGIAAFILLTLLTITGMMITTGILFRIWEPATAWSIHRAIGTTLVLAVGVHLVGFLLDSFIKLRVQDIFIPFVSPYKPLFVSFGIFGLYALVLVLATSLYTMVKHPRFWRIIHYSGFIMYALIFLHILFIGTDAKYAWLKIILWGSAAIMVVLGMYRLIWKHHVKPNTEP